MILVTFTVYKCTGFLNPVWELLFSKSFALRVYAYLDLDPIVFIGKYLFISVGMTTRHAY